MRNRENEKFDKTEDFLDLMSRSERKAWERAHKNKEQLEKEPAEKEEKKNSRQEKYALVQEQKEVKKILKDNKPLEPISKENIEDTQSMKALQEDDLQVGEIGKTQHFLNLTSEITAALGNNIEENLFPEEKKKSGFNPITWIGLLTIFCFGFFIYLVISSGYDEELLLLIDSGMLLGITFIFGLSIISSKKWTKIFSIFNLLVILTFVGINIFLLYDWSAMKEKEKKKEEPAKEIITEKHLSCKHNNLEIQVVAKENSITSIERIQTFDNEEEKKAILEKFNNQEGITSKLEGNKLTVTFDFSKVDPNQYKNVMRSYLEYYRDSSDFTYVKDSTLDYNIYKETDLKEFECTEKEES